MERVEQPRHLEGRRIGSGTTYGRALLSVVGPVTDHESGQRLPVSGAAHGGAAMKAITFVAGPATAVDVAMIVDSATQAAWWAVRGMLWSSLWTLMIGFRGRAYRACGA